MGMTRQFVAVLLCSFLVAGCDKSETRRVIVAYPEQWSEGEYRNCALGEADPATGLQQLDCDLHAPETPRARMFTMDVQFNGKSETARATYWTCEKRKDSLVCRN